MADDGLLAIDVEPVEAVIGGARSEEPTRMLQSLRGAINDLAASRQHRGNQLVWPIFDGDARPPAATAGRCAAASPDDGWIAVS